VTPFLYSGVIRAVDPVTHVHPKYKVEVTIEPEDEMSKFVLLSLHGIPKPPKKEQVSDYRGCWLLLLLLLLLLLAAAGWLLAALADITGWLTDRAACVHALARRSTRRNERTSGTRGS
jgi:hypothetical protein